MSGGFDMDKNLKYKIRRLLQNNCDAFLICNSLNISYETYNECLKEMRKDEEYKRSKLNFQKNNESATYKIRTGNTKTFCFLSDLHLGSLYDASDILDSVYDECENRMVTAIFCCGDVVNGCGHGKNAYQDLINYTVDTIPERRGIKLYTIGGNHEESVEEDTGLNILEDISKERSDIVYLGAEVANLSVNKITIKLCHGTFETFGSMEERIGGIYGILSKSYTPDIIALGHIHKSGYQNINGTHILQCSSLEENILNKKKFYTTPERSVWFVTIRYDRYGLPIDYNAELVSFPSRDPDIMKRKLNYRQGKNGKSNKK